MISKTRPIHLWYSWGLLLVNKLKKRKKTKFETKMNNRLKFLIQARLLPRTAAAEAVVATARAAEFVVRNEVFDTSAAEFLVKIGFLTSWLQNSCILAAEFLVTNRVFDILAAEFLVQNKMFDILAAEFCVKK